MQNPPAQGRFPLSTVREIPRRFEAEKRSTIVWAISPRINPVDYSQRSFRPQTSPAPPTSAEPQAWRTPRRSGHRPAAFVMTERVGANPKSAMRKAPESEAGGHGDRRKEARSIPSSTSPLGGKQARPGRAGIGAEAKRGEAFVALPSQVAAREPNGGSFSLETNPTVRSGRITRTPCLLPPITKGNSPITRLSLLPRRCPTPDSFRSP